MEEKPAFLLQELRSKLLDVVSIPVMLFFGVFLFPEILRSFSQGFSWLPMGYAVLYACFIVSWFYRRHLSFRFRALLFSGIFLLAGVAALFSQGLNGGGQAFLFGFVFFSFVFWGEWPGVLSSLFSLGLLALAGGLMASGVWVVPPNVLSNSGQWTSWVSAMGLFSLLCVASGTSFFFVGHRLLKSLEEERKRGQEIYGSWENLKITLDSISDGVIVTDTQGFVIRMNRVAEQMTGWTMLEARGKELQQVFHIFDSKTGKVPGSVVAKVIESGQVVGFANHTILQSREGRSFHVADSASPLKDADGNLSGVVVVFRDVTEDYLAQENLLESEAKYRGLFESISSCVAIYRAVDGGKDFEIVDFNPAAEKNENLPRHQVVGKRLLQVFPGVKEFGLFDILLRVWKTGEPEHFPLGFYKDERVQGWKENFVLRLPSGEVVAVYDDVSERVRGQQDLQNERDLLQGLLDNLFLGVTVWDKDGALSQVNAGFTALTGYNLEDVPDLDSWFAKAYPDPEYRGKVMADWEVAQGQGKSVREFRIHCKDGQQKDIEFRGSFLTSQKAIVTLADISARKESEKRMALLSQRLSLAVESAGIGVWELDFSDNHLSWDFDMYSLYGIEPKDFGGQFEDWRKGVHPQDLERAEREVQQAVEGKRKFNTQFRVVHPDGSIRHLRAFGKVLRDAQDRPTKMLGVNYDITPLVLAEESLRSSERRFRSLIESVEGISIYGYDQEMRVFFWNRAAEKLYGFSFSEVQGKCLSNLIFPESAGGKLEALHREWKERGKMIPAGETVMQKKDKSPVFVFASRVLYETPTEKEWFCFDVDLTPIHQVQDELIKAKEKAEEGNRLKSAFLANMSHEIRTPMNGILGFSRLLQQPDLSGEQRVEFIELIQQSGKRMLNLINDLIDISKIESGQMEVTISPTDVKEMCSKVLRFFQPEARQKGLQFSCENDLGGAPLLVDTDGEKVYAVLVNLVKNALKYTESGSIHFGYGVREEQLEVFVSDTGKGIPAGQLKAVFERFVKVELSPFTPCEGAGLGLAISKAYVEMLGGVMQVESREAKGSRFSFIIPLEFSIPK
ncbi:MAG TPA: PAS domain S-box protein [Thermotogota bacterium]|nr:PAS domain S-box protein [Thermotogota bacterium]